MSITRLETGAAPTLLPIPVLPRHEASYKVSTRAHWRLQQVLGKWVWKKDFAGV